MSQADTFPVTGLPKTGLPTRALVVGDPFRAEQISHLLDNVREVAHQREYRSFVGDWNGSTVVVSSHGVGAPGAICLFQELMDAGVDTIIRLGTAGALLRGIGDGDLIIAESCVRDDGVTHQLVPESYPAAANPEVVIALAEAARRHDAPHHRGIVWTRAAFYPGIIDLNQAGYVKLGVLAIEMELSALLVLASTRGVRAGGGLVIDGATADDLVDTTGYDPHRTVVADGVSRGISVTLDALVALPELA
ncbi:purine-nucleoside phosphorylase [Cryobacterium zongtaii]|uniref:Uridine phosphorylase n=1 Tax=Cryobacterium zongtaii TaxID=1259217 RepID=A0A2S3ZIK0_9MICO|nr:nucleoside phosphorylase [Cryobacterium zongtaii]POH67001.1 purine-nucleoside phosphorylase [Cryobacterium zongtaii]